MQLQKAGPKLTQASPGLPSSGQDSLTWAVTTLKDPKHILVFLGKQKLGHQATGNGKASLWWFSLLVCTSSSTSQEQYQPETQLQTPIDQRTSKSYSALKGSEQEKGKSLLLQGDIGTMTF